MEEKHIKPESEKISAFEKTNLDALAKFLNSEIGEAFECEDTEYSEKRKALRLSLTDVEAWVKFTELVYSEKYEASTLLNLSSVGAKIQLNRKVKIGKQAMLRFVFPDHNEFFVYGRVVWSESINDCFEYGIQFDKRNSLLSNKIIHTHLDTKDDSEPMVTIEKTPEAFIQAINTFFSTEKRRFILKNICKK